MNLNDIWKDLGDEGKAIKNIFAECIFETVDMKEWILCSKDGLRAAYKKVD
jgi:hypothetical protein